MFFNDSRSKKICFKSPLLALAAFDEPTRRGLIQTLRRCFSTEFKSALGGKNESILLGRS